MIYILLLLIGITAGLRAATPLAAISVGAALAWIDFSGTWASFLASPITAVILVVFAVLELVRDQLPNTPSRKEVSSIVIRSVAGALCGALLGMPSGNWIAGIVLGLVGALIGTYGGHDARRRLAAAFGRDLPAALIEDVIAIILALCAVYLA